MTLHLLILLLSLSYITTAQNDTNETTTEMPETTPSTTYYTTTDLTTTDLTTTELTTTSTTEITTDEPTRTLEPSLEPTLSPISDPSPSPTDAPNILSNNKNKKKGDAYLQKVKTKCISKIPGAITCNKVKGSQKDFWITAAKDVACVGATNDDDCIVDIGDCNDEYQEEEEEDTTIRRRRLLETSSNIIGVTITYLVVIRDPELVTSYEQRIENGKFNEEFSETVNDEYDDVEIDIEFEEATIGDPDEFLGNEDPTFGEIIASPYILLGIVCTIIGIIWLLFLRSSIENKYPSYLSQPASAPSMSGNAVEMVPQSSAAAE